MNTKKFGSLLKQKRTTLLLSQSKVAELCYLSKSTYNHYEHGLRLPTLETLLRLGEVLHTDVNEFIMALADADSNNENLTTYYSQENNSDILEESNGQYGFFIENFKLLDKDQQKIVMDIIDSILDIDSP